MQTWDAITARRNVREFADRPLAEADIRQILEAGRRSASARNWQPWDFVVLTDRQRLGQLSEVWQGAGHVAAAAVAVALVIPVLEEPRKREVAQFDLGQAAASMQLAAVDLGIATGHANVGDQDLARELLGVPSDREVARILDFGYPAGRPLAPGVKLDRRPFDEVVHWDRF